MLNFGEGKREGVVMESGISQGINRKNNSKLDERGMEERGKGVIVLFWYL